MDEQTSHTDVIIYVKNILNEMECSFFKEERCRCCKDMFDYLIVNKWFLRENKKFFKAVKSKLYELKDEVTPSLYKFFKVNEYIEIVENMEKEFKEKEFDVPEKPKKKVKKKFELIIEI